MAFFGIFGSMGFLFGFANISRGFGASRVLRWALQIFRALPLGYELRFRRFLAFSGFANI